MANILIDATEHHLGDVVIYRHPTLSANLDAITDQLQLNYLLAQCPVFDIKAPANPDPNGRADLILFDPNSVIVKTKSAQPSILILSANHFPGWRAYVDGNFVTNLRVDYNLRGVVLPVGEHTVEFIYRPKSVLIGAVISLLTLIGLVIWWRRLLPVT